MSKVTIKIHINEDLERTHHFDTNKDRSEFIHINRNDVELQTLTEDIPRLFRAYKDIKFKIRDDNYRIHYYSYTEGEVEIDNNDDLITEIDVIFPDDSSDDNDIEPNNNENVYKYIDIRATFQPIPPMEIKQNDNIIEGIPGQSDNNFEQKQNYIQRKTRSDPPEHPPNDNFEHKRQHQLQSNNMYNGQNNNNNNNNNNNFRGGSYKQYKHRGNRRRNYAFHDQKHHYKHVHMQQDAFTHHRVAKKKENSKIEATELDILPYRWQLRLDIKDEGIKSVHVGINENKNETEKLEYDNDEKDNNMYYWKNQTSEQSFYYEQRYNRNGNMLHDKQSFADSFNTVRRRTRFEGRIISVSKQKGFGYVTPNYPQKKDKTYGIFFHFEQSFPKQYKQNCRNIIECERDWIVSFEVKMFNKIANNYKFKKNGYRAINFKIVSKGNMVNKPAGFEQNENDNFDEIIYNNNNHNNLSENKNDVKYDEYSDNKQRFTGEVVQILKDKRNGYVRDSQYGLIAFKFNECHGFDPFDLKHGIVIEYELKHINHKKTCAIHICICLLPYQWQSFDATNNEWFDESVDNAKYLERNYNKLHNKINHIITIASAVNKGKKRRLDTFQRKILKINKQQRIGYVEFKVSYNQNIGLIFGFNDCRFDWNELQIGNEIVYELEKIVTNNAIYWKVINIEQATKPAQYKTVIVWKWKENDNDKYNEYENETISEKLEKLKINESEQLDSAREVTKISKNECYDVDTFNDTFRYVKRFTVNVLV